MLAIGAEPLIPSGKAFSFLWAPPAVQVYSTQSLEALGVAYGFSAATLQKLAQWWLMPAIFDVSERESLGNRLYPFGKASPETPERK